MGLSTLTAARILEGQMRGESGEENRLSFENFPYTAFSKTYSADQQTPDSAATMSAIVTGLKSNGRTVSVNRKVSQSDHAAVAGNESKTILEMAEESGRSTGIVTTENVTGATPAACYAHTAYRYWESDRDIAADSSVPKDARVQDIASQLIGFKYGDGLDVVFGGGRSKFLPRETKDPEYADKTGERFDKRDLTAEWLANRDDAAYIWNRKQFDSIDLKKTRHVLGLFEPQGMPYAHDTHPSEPSLTEMTSKAIDLLSQNKKGYFLIVEADQIDTAHHATNAYHALTDTIELSNAVRAALAKVDLRETLIIVTADHDHTLTISGSYNSRGNNILGLSRYNDRHGKPRADFARDRNGMPFTPLGYANGPGHRDHTIEQKDGKAVIKRADVAQLNTTDHNYRQDAMVPLSSESHSAADVAIFAAGAGAYLVRGSMEQNWIFYVMSEAMKLRGP